MAKGKLTTEERIAALEKRALEIQNKAKQLKAQQRVARDKQARKEDTHRKVVLGGVVVELVKRGLMDAGAYAALIGQATLSDRDRATLAFETIRPTPPTEPES